jgi:hypothetical protein
MVTDWSSTEPVLYTAGWGDHEAADAAPFDGAPVCPELLVALLCAALGAVLAVTPFELPAAPTRLPRCTRPLRE